MATDRPLQLGMIGLGRMGANLVRRLMRDGHSCVVYDVNADVVKELASEGVLGAGSLNARRTYHDFDLGTRESHWGIRLEPCRPLIQNRLC